MAVHQVHATNARRGRRRVSRACDHCSRSKLRCDGDWPCWRCSDNDKVCQYTKVVRKRGPIPNNPLRNHGRRKREQELSTEARDSTPSIPSTSPDGEPVCSGHTWPLQDVVSISATSRRCEQSNPSLTSENYDDRERHGGEDTTRSGHLHVADHRHGTSSYAVYSRPDSLPAVVGPEPVHLPGRCRHSTNVNGDGSLQQGSKMEGRCIAGPSAHSAHFSPLGRPGGLLPNMNASDFDMHGDNQFDGLAWCRYPCLDPLLPDLHRIISPHDACDLLESFFAEQRLLCFRSTSPYMLTNIMRSESVLHPTTPRPMAPALLSVILWAASQTADLKMFDRPGVRHHIVDKLHRLSLSLIKIEDSDNYFRSHAGGWQFDDTCLHDHSLISMSGFTKIRGDKTPGSVDGILAMLILTLVISGGDFKADCMSWWAKTIRLARLHGLHMEDAEREASTGHQTIPVPTPFTALDQEEAKEERRRLFWLLYCLDRHLALSFNWSLSIVDGTFRVFVPLPQAMWENFHMLQVHDIPRRSLEPPRHITGHGFFEYFLPLMTVLGYIIDLHHRRYHPLSGASGIEQGTIIIEEALIQFERQLENLTSSQRTSNTRNYLDVVDATRKDSLSSSLLAKTDASFNSSTGYPNTNMDRQRTLMVTYSSYIVHVLYILLHGKWDPISMIEDKDDWITSPDFVTCSSHAIEACQAVSKILSLDPELTFMPYLFGIYLLHGSFIVLLFADRMPQLGPNESVAEICEIIIRAHEASIVTLDTIFQKNFRRVLRSMLYEVRGVDKTGGEEKARRRELLSLYRWTACANGLAY